MKKKHDELVRESVFAEVFLVSIRKLRSSNLLQKSRVFFGRIFQGKTRPVEEELFPETNNCH